MKELDDADATLNAARVQLRELGSSSLEVFKTNIDKVGQTWTWAASDAQTLANVFKNLEDDVGDLKSQNEKLRDQVLSDIGRSVGIYQTMGNYLRRYADNVTAAEVK